MEVRIFGAWDDVEMYTILQEIKWAKKKKIDDISFGDFYNGLYY